jgi:hypothetical protein
VIDLADELTRRGYSEGKVPAGTLRVGDRFERGGKWLTTRAVAWNATHTIVTLDDGRELLMESGWPLRVERRRP